MIYCIPIGRGPRASSSLSIVISEHSAKTLSTPDAILGPATFLHWEDQLVVETLVIPLQMVMFDVRVNNRAKMILSEGNHPVEAFIFYRSNKTLGVRVQIRTPRGWLDCFHTNRAESGAE